MKIKKAVIPVAGKGTRFLPATKQTPKEMLPILNIPMIHYVAEEAVKSGIEQIVFVTSSGKESIENYFDRNLELENFLIKNNKEEMAENIQKIGTMIEVISVRQKEQLGLGHAILCAKDVIGQDDFAVLLGDDIIINNSNPVTGQLLQEYEKNNASIIGVMEVPKDQTHKYGIVAGEKAGDNLLKMSEMVEKPAPSDAPTNLATPGRYILKSSIFDCLQRIKRGVGGEYQLTDAINMLAKEDDVYAYTFEGERYDTGSINGYIKATIDFALERDDTREYISNLMKDKVKTL